MNPERRYWQAVVRAAAADLETATTNSELKLAARRLMRARRRLAALHAHQSTAANSTKAPVRRRKRPP